MAEVVTLLGYMGSGKSTYGRVLSDKLGYNFIDLDDYIVKDTGMTISNIFETKGEKWFRDKETEVLKELIKKENLILSLGGGTPVYNNNIDIINRETKSVYLNASVDTLFLYLQHQKSKRPIISDLSDLELKDFISKHLSDRVPFYSLAKISVVTDNKTISEIVEELLWLLK